MLQSNHHHHLHNTKIRVFYNFETLLKYVVVCVFPGDRVRVKIDPISVQLFFSFLLKLQQAIGRCSS